MQKFQLFYAFFPKNKKNIDRVAIVNMTRAKWACVHCWYNPKYFMLTQCLEIKARGCCMHVFLVESLSSTSDTYNKSCACAVLAKSQKKSVLEVATTEVRAILVVVGIERLTNLNPVFIVFFDKDIKYLFITKSCFSRNFSSISCRFVHSTFSVTMCLF